MLKQGHLHKVLLSGAITHSWWLTVLLTLSVTFWEEERGGKKREKKPTEKRRDGRSSDEHPPLGSWYRHHPAFLWECPKDLRPRDLPQALPHWLFLWTMSGLIRACRECSVPTALCIPSWVSSGQPHTTAGRGHRIGKGQSRPLLATPQENHHHSAVSAGVSLWE